ncbi:ribosomal maturation YjgA family protein [Arthrobacter psychrolactophilus]
MPSTLTSRRPALLLAAVLTVALGLVIHFFVPGDLASLIADALYMVLVYLVLAFILPKAGRGWIALAAFALSAAIELAQLTGVPHQLAVSFPPSRLIFGTTFSALDLLAYAVGAVAIFLADHALARTLRSTWHRPQSE